MLTSVKSRKTFGVFSLVCVLVAAILLFFAQSGCKPNAETRKYVIGYIDPNPEEKEGAPGFLRTMPKYGYVEGKNTTYIKVQTKDTRVIESALRDMVTKKVDLILTMATPPIKMAKELTRESGIPVVFIMYDAVASGIVSSFVDHPANITGVQLQGSTSKALEWLRAVNPRATHLFVPVCYDTGAAKQSLDKLRESCANAGFRLTVAEVKTAEELDSVLQQMPRDVDALFVVHSWLVGFHAGDLIREANRRHIPVISAGHVDYQHGLILSYAPSDDSIGAQAARLAHRILQGTSPAYLPVENAEVFLGINLQTARSAGVEIPETVLRRADHIIR